jgi:hypothetical protein
VPYQWRRNGTALGVAVLLTIAARAGGLGLVPSVALVAIYPLLLLPLGFYQQAELGRLRRLATAALSPG